MTTQMVRKQIYIQRRQDILLKRLSQARGLSEAEIIRQALERELAGEPVSTRLYPQTQPATQPRPGNAPGRPVRPHVAGLRPDLPDHSGALDPAL